MMYQPPSHLSTDVIAPILAKFDWPAPYQLERALGGIVIVLPRCKLLLRESFDSDMDLLFLPESTGHREAIPVRMARGVLEAEREFPEDPEYLESYEPASVKKVQDDTEDLLRLLFTMFPGSLTGDFTWVPDYVRLRAAELGSAPP